MKTKIIFLSIATFFFAFLHCTIISMDEKKTMLETLRDWKKKSELCERARKGLVAVENLSHLMCDIKNDKNQYLKQAAQLKKEKRNLAIGGLSCGAVALAGGIWLMRSWKRSKESIYLDLAVKFFGTGGLVVGAILRWNFEKKDEEIERLKKEEFGGNRCTDLTKIAAEMMEATGAHTDYKVDGSCICNHRIFTQYAMLANKCKDKTMDAYENSQPVSGDFLEKVFQKLNDPLTTVLFD